jgi:molecular chaperone GrpE
MKGSTPMSELTKEAMENEEAKSSENSEKSCEKEKKASKKELSKLTKELEAAKKELESVQSALEKEKEENGAQNDRYLRMMAEYDNFRKRATAEKDAAYTAALADVIAEILPVIDTLELALRYGTEGEQMTKGVQMTLAKFTETLEKLGVCEIETETFDPNFHNAVMHVEDDAFGEGQIVEVFQKGYKKGEKIIRYAMVKVAN